MTTRIEPIRDTVRTVLQTWQEQKKSIPEDPQGLLKKAFTTQELRHIKFQYLRGGILGIMVESSSWLYHLSLKKEGLLAKLHKKAPAIKDIRFCIGEIN